MHAVESHARSPWGVMIPVALSVFLATVDGSIVNIALPVLERDLHTHFSRVEWVVLAYLMTVTCLMLGIGRLADMLGKKPLFLAGVVIFTVGSGLCGAATTIAMLIACRVIQGLGAALLMALSSAIVTEAFPAEQRGKALGIVGLSVSLGIITGPTLGGLILGYLSWNWIFFVNLPLGLLTWVWGLRAIPNNTPAGGQRFDVPGAVWMLACLLCLSLGLTQGQHIGFGHTPVVTLLTASALLLGVFVWTERRSDHPMIELSLFRNIQLRVNLVSGLLVFVCGAGTLILMPYYLQNVRDFSPQLAGLLLATQPVAVGLVAPYAGALSDHWGTHPLIVAGLILQVIGYFTLCSLGQDTSTLGYVLRFIPVGIGFGCFQSPNNSAIMGGVPRQHLGVASGLLAISRTLGQVVGIAVLGAVWAARQRQHQGMEASAIQVKALQETLVVITIIIALCLLLNLWAWFRQRRNRFSGTFCNGAVA